MTRLTVHLDVVYEVQGSLPDPGDDDASTALLEDLMSAGGAQLDRLNSDDKGWRLEPTAWRVKVEGYGDLTVGPEAFEEGS